MLTFSSLNETAEISGIKLEGDVIERLAVYLEEMKVDFLVKAGMVHRKTIFQILTRLLRLCPVDTGRLRGSWTPFMDVHGFNAYQKYLPTPSILGSLKHAFTRSFGKEVEEGKSLGSFVDAYLNTTITSNVVYAAKQNEINGYLTAALIWGDNRYKKNMEAFLMATARAEAVVDPIKPGDDGQGGS